MKNKMSKIAFVVLSFVFVLSTCMTVFALTSLSVSNTQNGIVATLNFNKQEYNANEEVEVTLNVKNNNSYAVKNIQTELIVPSTIKLSKGSLKGESFSLNAGESKVQEVALERVVETSNEPTTNSPQTGDNVVVYIAMMTISAVGLVVIAVKKKWIHKKGVMSLVLCFTLVGAMTLTSVVNAESTAKEFTVEGTIKYDGEDVVIKGKVTYDYEVYSKVQIDGVNKGMYAEGNTVNITAEDAPEGKHFAGWTVVKGNVTLADANSSTTTFVMGKEDVEIKSNYEVNTYTIDVTLGENGKVTPEGKISVKHGESKKVTITANEGYHIENLESSGKKYQNTLGNKWKSFTIDYNNVGGNYYVKADFAIDTFTISASVNESSMGTITETATVNYGDSKTFTIAANTDYHIVDVEVDGVSKGAITSYTFENVKETHTIKATFAINPYTITATAGANGTITESARLNTGDSKTFTMTANSGYGVKDVKVDGISVGPVTSYTFENVNETHTIEVEFDTATIVTSAQEFRDAVTQDGIIILANDITLDDNGNVEISKNVIIHGDGHSVIMPVYSGDNYSRTISVSTDGNANVKIENCVFKDSGGKVYLKFRDTSTVEIYGGSYERLNVQDMATLVFVDGSIEEDLSFDSDANITLNNGVFLSNVSSFWDKDLSRHNVTLRLWGGTYYFDPTKYLDADKYIATKTKDADNVVIWVVTKK